MQHSSHLSRSALLCSHYTMSNFKLLEGLSSLSHGDRIALSQFGQGPHRPVPHLNVHGAFESKVDSHPDVTAAVFEHTTVTYQQLDTAANRLANYLLASGLQPKERVCLVVSRSLEMLVGIFAILKAGCQYVPIDGGVASGKQLDHIFHDTAVNHILCLPKFKNRVQLFAKASARITLLALGSYFEQSSERPVAKCDPSHGCYAIYTSGKGQYLEYMTKCQLTSSIGSTGTPKGVDVSHANVTNALLLEPANLGIRTGSKVGSVLSIAFDMGAWEILACLMNGGTLYMRSSRWEDTLKKVCSDLAPLLIVPC
jgi:non-ribosomal peptide synthetase component F